MKFKIDFKINDGKLEAPPYEIETDSIYDFELQNIIEEFESDHGAIYGPGSSLTVTRVS